jgi:transcriptional regulator with XRE-family HTH domain
MFLRKYRKATRFSATELANKLGVTVHGYRRWERGEVEPRASQLGELSIILECSIDDLVFDKPSDDEANRITIRIKPGELALIEVLAEEEKINLPYKTNLKLRNNKPETAKKRKTG